jgi:hypothetical protein
MNYEQECLNQLASKGLSPGCDQLPNPQGWGYHCLELLTIDPPMHRSCEGVQPYFPIPTIACIHFTNGAPDDWVYLPPATRVKECLAKGAGWEPAQCYCCCSCFAYGTPIAVEDERQRAIESLAVGDSVLAGWLPGTGGAPAWKSISLAFSQGVPDETDQVTVYLAYGPAEDTRDLICSSDQPLMLADGKLTRANRLVRGDQLMQVDGTPAEVQTIGIGSYTGGVHHIGTAMPIEHEGEYVLLDGHLIGAGGLVAGDYYLQLYFPAIDPGNKAEGHEERPELGSPEYAQVNSAARSEVGMLFGEPLPAPRDAPVQRGSFAVFGPTSTVEHSSTGLLTEAQVQDVIENGEFMPLSQTLPKALVETIFKQLTGFYPEIVFYLDWLDMRPNVYAIERYGEKVVVISGGLARLVGFDYEGLLFAVCAGIGRFSKTEPLGRDGFSGTGAADYWAFGIPPRVAFAGIAGLELPLKALKQFETLFDLVSAEDSGGNPDDPVEEPSLACRIAAMESAVGGGPLPPCAGGPEPPKVALNSVVATPTSARVQLSVPPTPESAEDTAHYQLSPEARITSAKPSRDTNLAVVLEVDLEPGKAYELTIAGIESQEGAGVDPNEDRVKFEVPAKGE